MAKNVLKTIVILVLILTFLSACENNNTNNRENTNKENNNEMVNNEDNNEDNNDNNDKNNNETNIDENESDENQSNDINEKEVEILKSDKLNKGVILFSSSGGEGFTRYYHQFRDKLVQDHSFFPFGWGEIEIEKDVYDWEMIDGLVKEAKKYDKKFAIAFWSAAHSYQQVPDYLFTEYNVRRITSNGAFINFENKNSYRGFEILDEENLIEKENVIAQNRSLLGIGGEFLIFPGNLIQKNYSQSIGLDYRIIEDGEFSINIYYTDGRSKNVCNQEMSQAEKGSFMFKIEKQDIQNVEKISFEMHGGEIVVDNVNISPEIPGVHTGAVAYPDFFNSIFRERYEKFIKVFYERYKDEPTISTVYVGGYGRWDEVSLGADYLNPKEDHQLVEEQWGSYGYTDDKYLDHIKWAGDFYSDLFKNSDKELLMQSIAFDVPGNTVYVNWSVLNYAKSKGFGIKVNGLTERMTEFDQRSNQYSWFANRHKHSDTLFYIEEAIQVNNAMSDVMGHPLSMINRILIDSIDYYWFYDVDVYDSYVRRYLHYANEQAGSVLVNKMYSVMGAYPYTSSHANMDFIHHNLWTGLFTKNSNKIDYDEIDSIKYAATTNNQKRIEMSIDDRQKWSGMYGSVVSFDYFDNGTDSFDVSVYVDSEKRFAGIEKVLGTVKRTNTNTWKTASFYNSEFTNSKKNSGLDMSRELIFDDKGNDNIKISHVEINYVPVYEYKKEEVEKREPILDNMFMLKDEMLEFEITTDTRLAEIAIPLKQINRNTVNVEAEVSYIDTDGKEKNLVKKDMYMPGEFVYLPLPISSAPHNVSSFIVRIKANKDNVGVLLDEKGEIAYKTSKFAMGDNNLNEIATGSKEIELEALKDFYGIEFQGNGTIEVKLDKKMPDGSYKESLFNDTIDVDKITTWYFEPQTQGRYIVRISGSDNEFTLKPLVFERIDEPKTPIRYLVGDSPSKEFIDNPDSIWEVKSGFKNMNVEDGIWTGYIESKNPVIETSVELNIDADQNEIFHLVMKNESSCPLSKLYWKTDRSDYSEENSVIIPTVANDSEFREYSFSLSDERGYKGKITGLKFMPVSGHQDVGKISIYTMELLEGIKINSKWREKLELDNIVNHTNISFE